MRDDTTLLWTGLTDPRLHPTVKVPDIERLGKLRGVAASRGCDDAILADPNRTVLEASTGSLVRWYEGKIVLPAHRERVLPGLPRRWWRVGPRRWACRWCAPTPAPTTGTGAGRVVPQFGAGHLAGHPRGDRQPRDAPGPVRGDRRMASLVG